jgi:hypothetical protein
MTFRSCAFNILATIWYYLNIIVFRILTVTVIRFFPQHTLAPLAVYLFKTITWWEEYWVDYYLNNGKTYYENVRLIENNMVCMSTTLMAYENVYGHEGNLGLDSKLRGPL